MSLATIAAQLLNEAGVKAEDILNEVGVDREGAVRELANRLNVDLNDLVDAPDFGGATPVEVTDDDVRKVREGLNILNRAFG
jgi:hypothetical protein